MAATDRVPAALVVSSRPTARSAGNGPARSGARPEERGGVLLRYHEAGALAARHAFVPADVAIRVAILTAQTAVRGLEPPAAGVAFADGDVVTVLELGGAAPPPPPSYEPEQDWPLPGADRALICHVGTQKVAVTGATVVATGVFDAAAGDGVLWRGEEVPALDVRGLYARAEAAIWAGRALGARTGTT